MPDYIIVNILLFSVESFERVSCYSTPAFSCGQDHLKILHMLYCKRILFVSLSEYFWEGAVIS